MRTQDVINSKILKSFIKGVFILIGLILILSYGVAALVISYDKNIEIGKNNECKVFALILILVCLPILVFLTVFLRFACLVKFHYDKLDNLTCIENKETLYNMFTKMVLEMHKIEMIKEVCPKVAEAIKSDLKKDEEMSFKLKNIFEESLTAVKTIKPDLDKIWDALLKKIKEIIELHSE